MLLLTAAVHAAPLPAPVPGAAAASCTVEWAAAGSPATFTVEAGCPEALRGAVEAAARAWVLDVGAEGAAGAVEVRRRSPDQVPRSLMVLG